MDSGGLNSNARSSFRNPTYVLDAANRFPMRLLLATLLVVAGPGGVPGVLEPAGLRALDDDDGPLDPRAPDRDQDGLTDDEERRLGTDPADPDTDRDGLLDGDEVHGVTSFGYTEPLRSYGADPRHPDVFVEVDWMESAGDDPYLNARIAYRAAADVHRVFERSGTGIRIHFDLGPDVASWMPEDEQEEGLDVHRFVRFPDPGKVVPRQEAFPLRPVRGVESNTLSLYEIYHDPRFFRPSRRNVFYYIVFAEQSGVGSEESSVRPGVTDTFGDDAARRLGLRPTGVGVGAVFRRPLLVVDPALERFAYSATFLHELGHQFGLGHGGLAADGGPDTHNYKPNYPSVMNYRYQYRGVDLLEGQPVLDFSHGRMPSLRERELLEPIGLGGATPSPHQLEVMRVTHLEGTVYPSNLDWNGNGRVDEAPVARDLDLDGELGLEALTDHDDWSALQRRGFAGIGWRAFDGLGLGAHAQEPETIRRSGDFDGDGLGDLLLFDGARLACIRGAPGGGLELREPDAIEERVEGGSEDGIESWVFSTDDRLLVLDAESNGRDEVLLHRAGRVALLALPRSGARLLWSASEIAAAPAETPVEAWTVGGGDSFLALGRSRSQAGEVLACSASGERVAILAWVEGELCVRWRSTVRLPDRVEERIPVISSGRSDEGEGATFLVRGASSLTEYDARKLAVPALRADVSGVIPPREGLDDPGWSVSALDVLHPIDVDGDGVDELLLEGPRQLGLLDETTEGLRLAWAAREQVGGWSIDSIESVLVADLLGEGVPQIVLLSPERWLALEWIETESTMAPVAAVEVAIPLPGEPGGEGATDADAVLAEIHGVTTGRFLAGHREQLLVQEGERLLLVGMTRGGFEVESVYDDHVGSWTISEIDHLSVTQADEDPEEEVIAKRGSVLAILHFSPLARTSRLARYDLDGGRLLAVRTFLRGDATSDATLDLSDAVTLLSHLFLRGGLVSCQDAADSDDSGELDLSDAIYLLNFLFLGGPAPPPPGPGHPGIDPTPDHLICQFESSP